MLRIPITMCHGTRDAENYPLTEEYLDSLMQIVADLGFQSIDYNQLHSWWKGEGDLPPRPFMFDVDHPVKAVRHGVHEVLARYGYRGNLFINTAPMEELYAGPLPPDAERETMTWEEIEELMEFGWHIGAHTRTHPNLSVLSTEDPSGEKLLAELEQCDETLERHLGITPRDFAFTGTSCSSAAVEAVKKRYRFGRLWISMQEGGTMVYQVDGKAVRYAEFVGSNEPDDADGGPPMSVRYITRESDPYLLPSMELQCVLMHNPEALRCYFEGALD
jgi:hypothetical protein